MSRFPIGLAILLMFALYPAGAYAVDMEFVTVGDAGNSTDDSTGSLYGSVGYVYRIGKYEVTNDQYTDFLNAMDPTGDDPRDLYNSNMESDDYGGITYTAGNLEGSKYAVKPSRGDKPVNYVSFWDACRFANWLHNGQGSGDTEDGAYTLTADGITNNTVTRNAGWQWAVTSEDEWYKAAYYEGGSDVYYDYPTGSNTAPTAEAPVGTDLTNGSANYGGAVGDLTDVGAYTFKPSDSPYGTFDQGGNVFEWNEAVISTSSGGFRGGSFIHDGSLHASDRLNYSPTLEDNSFGFRVASVPEPGSITMLVCGLLGLALLRRR